MLTDFYKFVMSLFKTKPILNSYCPYRNPKQVERGAEPQKCLTTEISF